MRKTVKIRINVKWHAYLKAMAAKNHMTMSKCLDSIFDHFSGEYEKRRKIIEVIEGKNDTIDPTLRQLSPKDANEIINSLYKTSI